MLLERYAHSGFLNTVCLYFICMLTNYPLGLLGIQGLCFRDKGRL